MRVKEDLNLKKKKSHNQNPRSETQALLLYSDQHLTLQGTNLIQDINNLHIQQGEKETEVCFSIAKKEKLTIE